MPVTGNLPASELTRGDFRNWIIKEGSGGDGVAHLLLPAADQDYDQYDMIVSVPWCGIADNAIDTGEEGTFDVREGIQIDTREIETGALFTTFGQEVWYNSTTKEYTDTEDTDMALVGYVVIPTIAASGVMRFEKVRYVTEGEAS